MGIPLSPEAIAAFHRYMVELQAWNEHTNLTAIKSPDEIQTHHFLDSLALIPALASMHGIGIPSLLERSYRIADVGCGPGFPGLALKLAWPALKLTAIEATAKKLSFISTIVDALSVKDTVLIHARAEHIGLQPGERESYDLVVARALAPLPVLVEYLLPLARLDGWVVAYKGAMAEQEAAAARQGILKLGGHDPQLMSISVPCLDERRVLIFIHKVRKTPSRYPRQGGAARKFPL